MKNERRLPMAKENWAVNFEQFKKEQLKNLEGCAIYPSETSKDYYGSILLIEIETDQKYDVENRLWILFKLTYKKL